MHDFTPFRTPTWCVRLCGSVVWDQPKACSCWVASSSTARANHWDHSAAARDTRDASGGSAQPVMLAARVTGKWGVTGALPATQVALKRRSAELCSTLYRSEGDMLEGSRLAAADVGLLLCAGLAALCLGFECCSPATTGLCSPAGDWKYSSLSAQRVEPSWGWVPDPDLASFGVNQERCSSWGVNSWFTPAQGTQTSVYLILELVLPTARTESGRGAGLLQTGWLMLAEWMGSEPARHPTNLILFADRSYWHYYHWFWGKWQPALQAS